MTDLAAKQPEELGRGLTTGLRARVKPIAIMPRFLKNFCLRSAGNKVNGFLMRPSREYPTPTKINRLTESTTTIRSNKFSRGFYLVNTLKKIHYKTNLNFYNTNTLRNRINGFQSTILPTLLLVSIFLCPLNLRQIYASESINIEVLASSIRLAENNPNYGILKPIKGRNYRKACIQTINHALKDWNGKGSFIAFLGSRYCPTSGNLRPAEKRLNRHWIKNVSFFYARFLKQKKGTLKKFNLQCSALDGTHIGKNLIKSS